VKLDVRNAKSWQSAVKSVARKWKRLDVLVNNAGYILPAYIPALTEEMLDRHFDINAKGVILGTSEASRIMKSKGKGHIVNIASLAGVAGIPGISVYSASKHAVRGFTLAAAQELRPHGITVSVICPDAVKTPMLDLQKDFAEAALTFSGSRYLEPADVVSAIHRALAKKSREILVPGSRGMLAKLASAFPSLTASVAGIMEKKGKANQTRFRKGS
jgi:3-oxoacyl-[acyl-carrier protein] reductase